MGSLFAAFKTVDYAVIGALLVTLAIAAGTKSKGLSATLVAVIAFFVLVSPPSGFITAHEHNRRFHPHEDPTLKKSIIGVDNDMLVKIGIGGGAAVLLLLILLPSTKKLQSAKATAENVNAAPGAQGIMRKEAEPWMSSFNTARGNASQGAVEMAFRALETSLTAGLNDPQRLVDDEHLAKLREKDARRFEKIVNKAERNRQNS